MMLANAGQRDDPGTIVNIGLTSGSMSKRTLASANNRLNKKKANKQANKQQDLEDSGWMALLWNVIVNSLPRVIIADYDERIANLGLPRMQTTLENGGYEIKLGRQRYQFKGGNLAPPAGLAAWNYQRYAVSTEYTASN
jgi:hypothetical protein